MRGVSIRGLRVGPLGEVWRRSAVMKRREARMGRTDWDVAQGQKAVVCVIISVGIAESERPVW